MSHAKKFDDYGLIGLRNPDLDTIKLAKGQQKKHQWIYL